jgi:hypothetical protein
VSKTFTVAEAQVLLPVLDALLRRAQGMAARADELEGEMQALSHRIFLTGGMHVDVVAAARRRGERDKAAQNAKDTLVEIDAIGVKVQDLQQGLLDFPCQMGGETVMLCWKMGEQMITHWHALEDDYSARKPLDARFDKSERERPN